VIDWRLATTPPTTLAGVAAVLRFANEIEDAGGEWPNTDAIGPDGWHYQLRATSGSRIGTTPKNSRGITNATWAFVRPDNEGADSGPRLRHGSNERGRQLRLLRLVAATHCEPLSADEVDGIPN
jgi:hypothetical protein